jgi:hypothetical protein
MYLVRRLVLGVRASAKGRVDIGRAERRGGTASSAGGQKLRVHLCEVCAVCGAWAGRRTPGVRCAHEWETTTHLADQHGGFVDTVVQQLAHLRRTYRNAHQVAAGAVGQTHRTRAGGTGSSDRTSLSPALAATCADRQARAFWATLRPSAAKKRDALVPRRALIRAPWAPQGRWQGAERGRHVQVIGSVSCRRPAHALQPTHRRLADSDGRH